MMSISYLQVASLSPSCTRQISQLFLSCLSLSVKCHDHEIRYCFWCIDCKVIMDKIPDQIGYLVLTEDGAVLESGGELENDERVAAIVTDLISLSSKVDPVAFTSNEPFKKISITYDDHWFVICLSNKKIYIVKRSISSLTTEGNTVNA